MQVQGELSGAELRVLREFLGLTGERLASWLSVRERSVRRWEYGEFRVPEGIAEQLNTLAVITDEFVANLQWWVQTNPGRPLVCWWDDETFQAAHPGTSLSASWHRAAVARAITDAPARVVWAEEGEVCPIEIPQ